MTLTNVQGSIMLEANAAASFKRVNARLGGGLKITSPYGGHRSEAQQTYLRQGFVRGLPGFNYAAPARQSNHEGKAPDWEGFAVDISNWRAYPGLHAAMVAEGWRRDPVEMWHYNYTGVRSQLVGVAGNVIEIIPAPVTPKPAPTEEEIDMAKIIVNCPDFAGVRNQKMNDSRSSFWIVGPASKPGAPVIEVTTNEARINVMLKARGRQITPTTDHSSLPKLSRDELFSFLESEVGYIDPRNDNQFVSGWKLV
jgi:hypothetical protein